MTQLIHIAAMTLYLALACRLPAQPAGLGHIVFPTSGTAEAQKHFIRGVLFLHSFEYLDAREEFRTAQKLVPGFAMAYWGEAMTYNEPVWFAQDVSSARDALKRLAPTALERRAKTPTEREKVWLAAVEILFGAGKKEDRDFAYAAAMKQLHEMYPDDQEASAFYALSLIGTCHRGRDFRTYMQAAAVAEEIFARNAEHPGALHYLIHCYDDPVHAPLGLRAARIYAKVAHEAAHARHMPSHIFFALGMWDEAARSNEDAWAASQHKAARHQQPLEAGGYHALWWLEYAYLQQGRFKDARRILQTMERIAANQLLPVIQFHTVQMRALFSIETGELYEAATYTSDLDLPAAAANLFAAGINTLHRGLRGAADSSLASLKSLPASMTPNTTHHSHIYPGDAQAVEIMQNELAALLQMADGKSKEAIALMRKAAAAEDKTAFEFGPPAPPKPAHELLGEILLQLGQPQLARVQFELALMRSPKRALSLLGLARSFVQSGDKTAARETYNQLRQMWNTADAELLKALDNSVDQL